MAYNAKQRLDDARENFATIRQHMPEVAAAFEELPGEVFKDGVLSAKTKRLMALCGAMAHGCLVCKLSQVEKALALGATADEILETCAVAMTLGGTMAASESADVVQLLKDLGKL